MFPDISDIRLEGGGDQRTFANSSVTHLLSVPALRPVLSCQTITTAAINVTHNVMQYGATLSMWIYDNEVEALANIANTCGRFSDDPPGIAVLSTACCEDSQTDQEVGGILLYPQISPRADVSLIGSEGEDLAPDLLDLAQGCPSLGAMPITHPIWNQTQQVPSCATSKSSRSRQKSPTPSTALAV